ncbi:MAG: DUF5606 domain-containing protein [Saprospiraceae bacterium]|nr:DUF5606 domain-containing protein [Saprospiraceae bacterium]
MKLEDLIAVSGLPGLYKMVGNRPNGLIVEDLDSGKRKFVSIRKHQFSPLETIAIFTTADSIPLVDVLHKMYTHKEEIPPVDPKSSSHLLRDYFNQILPDNDPYRVFPKDIKKIIRWFRFLDDRNLLGKESSDEEE